MTKKIQQQLALILIFILAIAFGFYYVVWSPMNAKYVQLSAQRNEIRARLDEMKRRAMRLNQLKAEMKLLELEVAELEKLLPKEKEIPELLRTVTKSAQRYGLKISNFTPLQIGEQPNYNEVPFQMTIQGSYHGLAYFLSEIGQEARILNVRDVNMIATTISPENPSSISVNFVLVAYTFKG